jgi:hypothetical protein
LVSVSTWKLVFRQPIILFLGAYSICSLQKNLTQNNLTIKRNILRTPNLTRFGGEGQVHDSSKAEFLDEIQAKVIIDFLLAIHCNLYSFKMRFKFLQIHATS